MTVKPESLSQKREPDVKRLRSGFTTDLNGNQEPVYSEYVMKSDYDRLREQLDAAERERGRMLDDLDHWRTWGKSRVEMAEQRAEKAESELEAVRKRTIEECARVCEDLAAPHDEDARMNAYSNGYHGALVNAAEAIRSLPLTGSGEK